jgi:soluble lytic murein transglycosylase
MVLPKIEYIEISCTFLLVAAFFFPLEHIAMASMNEQSSAPPQYFHHAESDRRAFLHRVSYIYPLFFNELVDQRETVWNTKLHRDIQKAVLLRALRCEGESRLVYRHLLGMAVDLSTRTWVRLQLLCSMRSGFFHTKGSNGPTCPFFLYGNDIDMFGGTADSSREIHAFLQALTDLDSGNPVQAGAALRALIRDGTATGPVSLLILADYFLKRDDEQGAIELLSQIRENDDLPLEQKRKAEVTLLELYRSSGDIQNAVALGEQILAKGTGAHHLRIHSILSELYDTLGDDDGKWKHLQKIAFRYPASPEAVTAIESLLDVKTHIPDEYRQLSFQRIVVYFENRRFKEAGHYASVFLRSKEEDSYHPAALLLYGKSLYHSGQRAQAAHELHRFSNSYSDHEDAWEADLFIARCSSRGRKADVVERAYRRFVRNHPDNKYADDSLWKIALSWEKEGNLESALAEMKKMAEKYPESRWSGSALLKMGVILFRLGKFQPSGAVFTELRKRDINESFTKASMYWLLRCRLNTDGDREASALQDTLSSRDPLSYYTFLSKGLRKRHDRRGMYHDSSLFDAHRFSPFTENHGDMIKGYVQMMKMREKEVIALMEDLFSPAEPAAGRQRNDNALQFLRRGDLFHFLGYREEARWAYRSSMNHAVNDLPLYMSIAIHLGNAGETPLSVQAIKDRSRALREMKSSPSRGLSAFVPVHTLSYPVPEFLHEAVISSSRKYGIDPFLIVALIREESLFDPDALSPAGAIGLMQIMPPTGERIAEMAGIDDYSTDLLRDPSVNIEIGTYYLQRLIARYRGNLALVLSEYNAGPVMTEAWSRRTRPEETDLYIESVTYSETRNYIKRVMESYWIYKKLSGDHDIISGEWFGS